MRFISFYLSLAVAVVDAGERPAAQDVSRIADSPAAAEPLDGWVMTASFPAAEAHQAAAADENHFYVINNTHVAAYDRVNAQRQWLSHGSHASHLNSGFVWQGRLYCAHSNYPREPNTSQIKVVDLANGAMSDFKDFGITDGSLTWAVRHDGAWWCNFAYYGDEQQQTRLVRFDDVWQETGSWTYPAAIYTFLGRHSFSGGIWHGDTLLVTDHDNRVIYRLRLPNEGTVLEWIDRRKAPFTGQGFAIDPLGGTFGGAKTDSATQSNPPVTPAPKSDASANISLIGIDRARRLVILAAYGT